MAKYKAKFPFIPDMGSVSDMIVSDSLGESKEENALWHLNSMRDHDGLANLEELPEGTVFEPIYE